MTAQYLFLLFRKCCNLTGNDQDITPLGSIITLAYIKAKSLTEFDIWHWKGRMHQTRAALTVLSSSELEQLSVKDRQLAQVIGCFVHFDAVTGSSRRSNSLYASIKHRINGTSDMTNRALNFKCTS